MTTASRPPDRGGRRASPSFAPRQTLPTAVPVRNRRPAAADDDLSSLPARESSPPPSLPPPPLHGEDEPPPTTVDPFEARVRASPSPPARDARDRVPELHSIYDDDEADDAVEHVPMYLAPEFGSGTSIDARTVDATEALDGTGRVGWIESPDVIAQDPVENGPDTSVEGDPRSPLTADTNREIFDWGRAPRGADQVIELADALEPLPGQDHELAYEESFDQAPPEDLGVLAEELEDPPTERFLVRASQPPVVVVARRGVQEPDEASDDARMAATGPSVADDEGPGSNVFLRSTPAVPEIPGVPEIEDVLDVPLPPDEDLSVDVIATEVAGWRGPTATAETSGAQPRVGAERLHAAEDAPAGASPAHDALAHPAMTTPDVDFESVGELSGDDDLVGAVPRRELEAVILRCDATIDQIDYFTLIGLTRPAPADPGPTDLEVRGAFHSFAAAFHPDVHRSADPEIRAAASRVFCRGAEAYRVLQDPLLRKRYARMVGDGVFRLREEDLGHARRGDGKVRPRVQDIIRSASARPYAIRADELFAAGELRHARLQLQLALARDPGNPLLDEWLRDLDEQIVALKERGAG